MHFYTLHELRRTHLCTCQGNCRVVPEHNLKPKASSVHLNQGFKLQSVILNKTKGGREKPQAGKFDFLVEYSDGKYIGIEVLTRPSKGKMLEKLRYAEQVDEFVFVLPSTALSIYLKPAKVFHKQHWGSALPKEFADPKIKVWLMDINTGKFIVKDLVGSVFSIE